MHREINQEHRKNMIIEEVTDKGSRKKHIRYKRVKTYFKQDMVVALVLICAQLLVSSSGIGYNRMIELSEKGIYQRRIADYRKGAGKLCAIQNACAKSLVKQLTEVNIDNGMEREETPVTEETTDTMTVAEKPEVITYVPVVEWEETGESEEVFEKQTAILDDETIIVDGKRIDEKSVNEKSIGEKYVDEIPEEDSDVRGMQLVELTTVGNFAVNQDGIIETCVDPYAAAVDDTIILPMDESCTGIGAGAFDEIVKVSEVMEVYIPANIIHIEAEAFDKLNSLIYIEVAEENPEYKSIEGVLYDREGNVVVYPAGREEDAW